MLSITIQQNNLTEICLTELTQLKETSLRNQTYIKLENTMIFYLVSIKRAKIQKKTFSKPLLKENQMCLHTAKTLHPTINTPAHKNGDLHQQRSAALKITLFSTATSTISPNNKRSLSSCIITAMAEHNREVHLLHHLHFTHHPELEKILWMKISI